MYGTSHQKPLPRPHVLRLSAYSRSLDRQGPRVWCRLVKRDFNNRRQS